jgi:LEA14-like dessication related protein
MRKYLIYKGEKCQPYQSCCQLLRKEFSMWWKILLSNSEKHAIRWRKYQSKYTMLIDREDIIGDQKVLLEKKQT